MARLDGETPTHMHQINPLIRFIHEHHLGIPHHHVLSWHIPEPLYDLDTDINPDASRCLPRLIIQNSWKNDISDRDDGGVVVCRYIDV